MPGSRIGSRSENADASFVHIVDDDVQVSGSIAALAESAGYRTCEYESGAEFSSRFRPEGDCCVILDLRLPNVGGMVILRKLHHEHPDVPAIVVSAYVDVSTAVQATRDGALDVLQKPFAPRQLLSRIGDAMEFSHQRHESALRHAMIQARIRDLTQREREVQQRLCRGMTVKEIAFEFGLSPKTVQIHRARVLKGMHVSSVVDLMILIHESVPGAGESPSADVSA